MNDLCADIGYKSLNHYGEQLCGDHLDIVEHGDDTVIVLADGLGSGVKASILSTLTSKIISTMLAEGLTLEDCVATIAATLPICSIRGVAYSTFTILHLIDSKKAELIQYDNPRVIMLREGKDYDYPSVEMNLEGKRIFKSEIELQEDDIFVLMSDGCSHAGIGTAFDFGWVREDMIAFFERLVAEENGYTAKSLSSALIDECNRLYEDEPKDDTTSCVIRMRKREPMNLLFGPPADPGDIHKMFSTFLEKEGKHIVCGGTTSSIMSKYLGKPLEVSLDYDMPDIPPIGSIEGIDLVTEGVITINQVLTNAKDYLGKNNLYEVWSNGRDGGSLISRMLLEEATDIHFFVGRAINPAHQNPDLPINFSIKMNLVKDLSTCLKRMGKRIKVIYY